MSFEEDNKPKIGKPPLILCETCSHTVQYHSQSFGTTCDFYRCKCNGWKVNKLESDVEFLTLDKENDLI